MLRDSNSSSNSDEQLFSLGLTVQAQNDTIKKQRKQIDEMLGSRTWRYTSFARIIFKAISEFFRPFKSFVNGFRILRKHSFCDFCGATLEHGFSHLESSGVANQNEYITTSLLKSVAIVIPVYGQIGPLKKLITSMKRDPNLSQVKVFFVDDRFDERTSKWLSENDSLANSYVIKCPKNLGFGQAVNLAISQLDDEILNVILLNSDIELPKNWISRFLAPFEDSEIGLATALATNSGANLTIRPPRGRNWFDVDDMISRRFSSYPSACTAIGYGMSIRLTAINKSEMFDTSYKDGYGEDSDLHYRVLANGFKSVVIDNLLVNHVSGASYSHKEDVESFKDHNRELFFSRWGDKYGEDAFDWNIRNPVKKIQCEVDRYFSDSEIPCDVLLVVPSANTLSGGIRMAFEFAAQMQRTGMHVVVLTQSGGDEYVQGLTTIGEDCIDLLKSPQLVFATGVGTFELSISLARKFKSKIGILFQGPEYYFNEGQVYRQFRHFMRNADLVLAVSRYLCDVAQMFTPGKVYGIDLGPDTDIFYNQDLPREKTIVVASRPEFEKGLWLCLPILEFMIINGWSVKSFGIESDILKQLESIKQLGVLNSHEITTLFNTSELYLDLSLFEGLGLVPLEAQYSGAIPILTRKGAPENLFVDEFNDSVIWLESPIFTEKLAGELLEITQHRLSNMRANFGTLPKIRNIEIGLSQAATYVADFLNKLRV